MTGLRNAIVRILFLMVLFIAGTAGTAMLLNSESTDNRSDMNDPTSPVLMIKFGSSYANRMYGYKEDMQTDFTRDSVTPLDTSKELTFGIDPYETEVHALSYEIRTSDGSKVIENKKIKELAQNGEFLETTIHIDSDLRMTQEYSLKITLDTEHGDVFYYTRVMMRSVLYTEQYVQFVQNFADQCLTYASAEKLASYLESNNTSANPNYANININSTLSQISWGSMAPTIIERGVPVIKDINETTASISMEYKIMSTAFDGQEDYYNVTEFYRLRYTDTRIMLLDFNRSASQILSPRASSISTSGLLLGIRDRDVTYMASDDVSIVAFVQEGDLWTFAPNDGKLVRAFSFRRNEASDFRDNLTEHNIKIIRVGDNGDVDFVLYGYMNRGEHEGYCGIGVYRYSNENNVVEEKVFIPSTESYEFIEQDLGKLSYVNRENQLFILFADKLYKVDIDNEQYDTIDEGIDQDHFVVSMSNRHAAWLVNEGETAGQIKEIDFENFETRMIVPDDNVIFRVLGFMNEDLIYGNLTADDIITDQNGYVWEGIRSFKIESFDGTVKKEYSEKESLYITDVTVSETMMEFNLSKKNDSGYAVQQKDNIMNNKKASESSIDIELAYDSDTGTMIRMVFEEEPEEQEPLVIYSKMINQDKRTVAIEAQEIVDGVYYIYGNGGLDSVSDSAADAVNRADEIRGVVLNRAQQYVWERGNKKTQLQLNANDIPMAFKSGIYDIDELTAQLGDAGTVMNLSGCTLESVLYEVSAQRAVVAKTGADTCVTIVGYDEYNTYLYDASTGETYPYGMNDSTELFENAGNIFISYVEKDNI